MSKKRTSKDLNQQADNGERKRQKVHIRGQKKIAVIFDGRSIQNAIVRYIKREDTAYVVGCVAWLSNKRILKTMSENCKGVTLIVTKDKLCNSKSNQLAYSKLSGCYQGGVIRTVGTGRGRFKSLLHHKFLVGLDGDRQPLWVSNGSFNLTENAVTNIENIMILDDPAIATDFFDEFKRLHAISAPLRITKKKRK